MQKLLGLVAGRLSEEIIIKFFDVGVVVGAAPEPRLIVAVKPGGALDAQFIGGAVGLSSAADAAAGAGHHFDKVIGSFLARGFGGAHLINNLFDVGQAVSHGDADGLAGNLDGAFLDASLPVMK